MPFAVPRCEPDFFAPSPAPEVGAPPVRRQPEWHDRQNNQTVVSVPQLVQYLCPVVEGEDLNQGEERHANGVEPTLIERWHRVGVGARVVDGTWPPGQAVRVQSAQALESKTGVRDGGVLRPFVDWQACVDIDGHAPAVECAGPEKNQWIGRVEADERGEQEDPRLVLGDAKTNLDQKLHPGHHLDRAKRLEQAQQAQNRHCGARARVERRPRREHHHKVKEVPPDRQVRRLEPD
eukprot:3840246-Prymnesium_polylepis.1